MNLITGASGIIGAHVALQLLEKNEIVVAVKRADTDVLKTKKLFSYYTDDYEKLFSKIKWVTADVTDIYSLIDALENIDTVYHCAGFVSFDANDNDQMYKVNSTGTANMVNACLEKNIKILCHVSSIATLQNADHTKNISETLVWKNSPRVSDYAISKYNGEREVWRGIEEGLNAVIVNPGLVLSPGFWNQSSGKLIGTCFKGTPFYTNGSSAAVFAKDVAACMIELVHKNLTGQRFIITGQNYTFKELLSLIHEAFAKRPPSFEAGKILLNAAKLADLVRSKITGSPRLLTKATMNASLEKNTFSNSKIVEALNYNFKPLEESVKFVCDAYVADKNLKYV